MPYENYNITKSRAIDGELAKIRDEIKQYAIDYGLDFFDVIYEVCDYDTISILAAQGGFPSRYPHWKFGMQYDNLTTGYTYGLQKIYEMVINTDPCYAYLLKSNNLVDQKLVMAHVYGHSDFFKNNMWFSHTDRKMMDVMANHATKIRRYMEKHGIEKVEKFIDAVLSLENLLDIYQLYQRPGKRRDKAKEETEDGNQEDKSTTSKALASFLRSKARHEKKKGGEKVEKKAEETLVIDEAQLPDRDVLRFLMDYAPIEEWQADIIGILREEAYYFLPQRMTKIMNEGWASLWHARIMTEKALDASEIVDFADKHAGVMVMQRNQLNPYKLGVELYHDIEHRWDTGKFGKAYNECNDMALKSNWDLGLKAGKQKIFETRKTHNDITFIDEFLTPEFCERQQLFTYKYNPRTGRNEIDTRDFEAIKTKLLSQLTNFGSPLIEVSHSNYENRGELLLNHLHHGVDLDLAYAKDTMKNIHHIWKRPVNLATKYEEKEVVFKFDGKELKPNS